MVKPFVHHCRPLTFKVLVVHLRSKVVVVEHQALREISHQTYISASRLVDRWLAPRQPVCTLSQQHLSVRMDVA